MTQDYEKDIQIDESGLDVEWLRQPKLMFFYTKMVAELRRTLDRRKERLNIVKAELDKKIRQNPADFDIEKITETAVSNTILTQEAYKEASADIIDTNYELSIAQAAVSALNDKRTALENLVRLYGQQYFAGPSVPRNITKEWEQREKQKQANTKIGETLVRRRRTE
jgi:hypothetical protein